MDEFRIHLLSTDRAVQTTKRHIRYIGYVLAAAPSFSIPQIEGYLASLKLKGCKNTYLNHIISSIRAYAHFKGLKEHLKKIRYKKEEPFEKAVMSDEEIEAFLSLPKPPYAASWDWYMWTVFFSIMAFSGLRPGEVAKLTVEDIDFGLNVFHIRGNSFFKGKTSSSNVAVPIAINIQELLKEYLEKIETTNLFPSRRGGNQDTGGVVNQSNWWQNFKKRLKLLGVKRRNLSVYSLRHSYGTRLAEADINLYTIKKLMRHSNILTTETYMHLSTKDLQLAQNKLPLIRRKTRPKQILQSLVQTIKNFRIDEDQRFRYTLVEDGTSVRFECNILDDDFFSPEDVTHNG